MPFVLIAPDHTDAEAPARRLAARAAHLEAIDKQIALGTMVYGGAMVNEAGQMTGSIIVTNFATRAEAESWLDADPYIAQKVWNRDACQLIETKTAPAFAGVGPQATAA